MKIKIPKIRDNLLVYIILWNILSAVLIAFLGVPRSILYFTDALNAWLFLSAFRSQRYSMTKQPVFLILFIVIGIMGSIINLTSPILTIWGIRQTSRYLFFFYSCAIFMTEKNIRTILKVIEIIFWISVPLCTYEGLFVTYPQGTIVGDMVGGIYYRTGSANAPLNIILVVYSVYIILWCLDGKISFKKMIITVAAGMWMAILAELKLFIVEMLVVIVVAMIISKVSWKTITLFIVGILAFNIIITGFVSINARGRSYYTNDLFSFESMIKYATRTEGYDGVGDLNRFTAIQELIDKFFRNDLFGLLFGYGIGSAEYSKSNEMLTSTFYNQYGYLHYQYFTHAFVFIETGLLGLISYLMIFISSLKRGIKVLKGTQWKKFYMITVMIMVFLVFYNTTMRNEFCAYILYAILAIPFAVKNCNYETYNEDNNYEGDRI